MSRIQQSLPCVVDVINTDVERHTIRGNVMLLIII